MKASPDLYELIHAMSPSEKRYFKIYAKRNATKGKNSSIRIFEWLEKQEKFNEAEIIAGLPSEKDRKQYPVVKNYLYKLVLKSLRLFHSEQSIGFQLKEMLMNVEILMRKDLIRQCIKQLEKARKLALQYEKYEFLLEISAHRISMAVQVGAGNLERLETSLEEIFEETNAYFERYQNIQAYKKLSMQMLVLNRREAQIRTDTGRKSYAKILEDPLMQSVEQTLSMRAASFYLQSYFIYYFAHRDYEKSFDYAKRIVQAMETHQYLVQERPENYINAVQNMVMVSTMCRPLERSLELIDQLKNFAQRCPKVKFDKATHRKVPLFAYNLEIHLLMEHGDLENAAKLVPEAVELLEQQGYRYNVNEGYVLMDLYFKIARLYLFIGNFREAKTFVNRILNQEGVSGEYEVYLMARVLLVVVLFEAGEFRLLEYAVISLYRYLRKQQKLFRFEKALINFIRKSSGVPPGAALTPHFKQLRDELSEIVKDPQERHALQQFDIITWLDSKI